MTSQTSTPAALDSPGSVTLNATNPQPGKAPSLADPDRIAAEVDKTLATHARLIEGLRMLFGPGVAAELDETRSDLYSQLFELRYVAIAHRGRADDLTRRVHDLQEKLYAAEATATHADRLESSLTRTQAIAARLEDYIAHLADRGKIQKATARAAINRAYGGDGTR